MVATVDSIVRIFATVVIPCLVSQFPKRFPEFLTSFPDVFTYFLRFFDEMYGLSVSYRSSPLICLYLRSSLRFAHFCALS